MHTSYHPDLQKNDKNIILSSEESHHLVKVLRHTDGMKVQLMNGKGLKAEAIITLTHQKKCELSILHIASQEPENNQIHLAICPTKNMDRLEWFIEKATELGVDKITLLQCKNNERKIVKMERLEKIVLSATKQSQRFYKPELIELTSFSKFIKQNPNGGLAHCYEVSESSIKTPLNTGNLNSPVLIGPEGDFTLDEVKEALDNGYCAIDLGENRLRTETAALFAVAHLAVLRNY
ncbi:MAG: 16S rRNA (uracil1498-N3)-methyltransferase [Lentimonas sp.]|jgi:16S rRNA (uracil1498-N3)-methyltransferase